jgi:hypothetical protein
MAYETEPPASVIEEAIAVIRGGLGKAELEFVSSLTAPFFWVLRDSSTGKQMMKNGSVFFLDAGKGAFAVTAAHVVDECLKDTKSPMFVQCMIGSHGRAAYPFHLGDRIIDAHPEIDIATLRFSTIEVQTIGRAVLTGSQEKWPPRLAEVAGGVTYCGFPGNGRRWLAPRELSVGCVAMGGIATSAHETSISIQLERDKMMQVLGDEKMPENFDFGGISGGPVLAIVQTETLRSWKPAGVVIQGPNPTGDPTQSIQGLEVIVARPIHFINADGTLDIARWDRSRPF